MASPDIHTLPAEYQRLLALAQERFQVELLLLEELRGGRTGALLYLVSLAPTASRGLAPAAAGPVRHLVLKLDRIPQGAEPAEIEQHKQALSLAPPDFARQHIAELAYEVVEGEQMAAFYAIAGQSLLQFRPLAHYTRQSQLETVFRATHDVLLNRWNVPPAFDRAVHPQALLERWLSHRLQPGGRISDFLEQTCCMDAGTPGFVIRGEVYPNPLAFGRNPDLWGHARPIDVLTGCQHGDLNTRNILVRFAANGRDLDGYYLIDFALFKTGVPLLFDQRYLEMAYLNAELEQLPLDMWVDLVAHLGREDTPDPQQVPVDLAGACAVLNAGRRAFREWVESSHASLSDDLWAQFWLAGAAAGLNFCNKRGAQERERLAGLIYAAAHLKRFCDQFRISSPAEVKLLYETARAWEAIDLIGFPRPARALGRGGRKPVRSSIEAGAPAVPGLPAPPVREQAFPEHVTPLVGRQREIAEIGVLLDSSRLVTLHGPGGIGKTRLALAVAEARRARYRDGAFFIPLLAHDSPSAIVPAIARALGVTFTEGRPPQDQLLDVLRPCHLLLVLDNLEHLLREDKAVTTLALVELLLGAAPGLVLLVTSRELLRLPQEQAYTVEGLPVSAPGPAQAGGGDDSAVELFRLHARRAQPSSPLDTEPDLRLIRLLCQIVAGMPLAIELAAAQLRLLSLTEISAGIESSLDVLETSLRGATARHRSMRAVFETSWDGLEPAERLVFARLSVFRGGFTLEAADQVVSAALRELTGLVDKSLIGRAGDGRFSQHPLVQRFAGYKLAELPGEPARTQGRHFEYYRALATQAAGEWEGARSRGGLEALRPEAGNVRAAWRWALSRRDWAAVSEVTDALWTFYRIHGSLTEAMELPEKALSEGAIGEPPAGSEHLAHWECRLGQGRLWLSQRDEADRHFRRMLAALGWPVPGGRARTQLAIVGQLALQAFHRLWPAFFIGRQAGRKAVIGEAYIAYGNLLQGAISCNKTLQAVYYTIRALNLTEAGGQPAPMSPACAAAGYMFFMASARSAADFYVRRAQALAGQEVSDDAQAWSAYMLGWYFFSLGEARQAGVQFDLAADAAARLGQSWSQGEAWIGQLCLSYSLSQYRRGLGYALQLRESGERRGDLGFIASADYWEGVFKLQWGRLEEAQAHLERSAAAPAEVMNAYDWMIVWTALARVYHRQGRLDLAVREADRFTRMVDENPSIANPVFTYGFAGAAEAYLAAWEAAGDGTRPERRAAEKTCRNLEKTARTFPYGRASARLYRGCCEWLNGRSREAHRAWAESLAAARKLGFPYEEGLAHYEIGRHLVAGEVAADGGDRGEHLERAAEIFARLEIPYELNLCRAAQGGLETRWAP